MQVYHILCCCSVTKSCPTLRNSVDCSTPVFPVTHHLPKFAQVHILWISDAIQPSHSLSPSSSAFNLSQHQGLFQWVSALHQCGQSPGASAAAPVIPVNIQGWFPWGLAGLISLLSKGFSRVFSSTIVWKHQFFGTWPSLGSNSHVYTWLVEKPQLWLHRPLSAKWCLCF